MADTIPSETSTDTAIRIPCKTCRELIPADAIKCTKCNSYQDWTRHLLRWNTVIIAIIGLLPLWGAAVSLYELAFAKKQPIIEALITSCNSETISLAYINSGTLDGIVTGYRFWLEKNGKPVQKSYMVKSNTATNLVVSPGQSPQLVDVKAYIGATPTRYIRPDEQPADFVYHLIVNWSDFRDVKHELNRNCTPR